MDVFAVMTLLGSRLLLAEVGLVDGTTRIGRELRQAEGVPLGITAATVLPIDY